MVVPPSPFYRVAGKALIRDKKGRLLVLVNEENRYEIPGGGWEHDETFEDCIRRECKEELQIDVVDVSDVKFVYRGTDKRRLHHILRLAAFVKVADKKFTPSDGMVGIEFVTREKFMEIDWQTYEGNIVDYVDRIWTS